MRAGPSSTEEHEDFRAMIRAFIEAEVTPVYDEVVRGPASRPAISTTSSASWASSASRFRPNTAVPASTRTSSRPSSPRECARAAVSFGGSSVHVGLCLPYLEGIGHRRAEAALVPRHDERRDHVRHRHDRAGHRIRPGRNAHHRKAVRRRHALRAQRFQDLHHRRRARRPRDRVRPHRPPREDDRRFGISLLVVDTKPRRATRSAASSTKLGLRVLRHRRAQLHRRQVVPAEDVLGEVNMGFSYLGQNLPRERLGIAVGAYAQAKAAVAVRRAVHQGPYRLRQAGRGVPEHQVRTRAPARPTWMPMQARRRPGHGGPRPRRADRAPMPPRPSCSAPTSPPSVIDRCLQLHGGYGYINEYPIARLYADNRVEPHLRGTSEVMKMIIAKNMGL